MRDDGLLNQVAQTLLSGNRFLIVTHPDPDGDAIGSMAAAVLALQDIGRDAIAFNAGGVPRRFRFLVGSEQIVADFPSPPFDVTVVLDCGDERAFQPAPPAARAALGMIVVIDHHATQPTIGDLVLVDSEAAAAGVLLFKVFEQMKLRLSLPVAEALFCSVMSDTGSFRYQNANSEALRVAAALIEHGVDPWRIASRLYEDRPRAELELLGRVLQTLVVSEDGLTACMTVTPEMLRETGCGADAVDGFINYARGVEGVEVAVLLWDWPTGVRVSLRSRGTVDVAAIAERFGGGGHHNAAGCLVKRHPAEIRRGLFDAVRLLIAKGS